MHMSPKDILLVVSIDFRDDVSAGTVEDTITELEELIKSDFPEISKIFIEAQAESDHQRMVADEALENKS